MIVHVKRDDGTVYQAVTVAIVYKKGYNAEFFILNSKNEFERVFAFKQPTKCLIPQVMIADIHTYETDWVKAKAMEGYKLFVENPKLLKKIRKGEKEIFPYGTDEYHYFSSLSVDENVNYGPIYVNDQNDIDNLLTYTEWFHDASIHDVKWNENKTELTLVFEGIWGIERLYLHLKGDVSLYKNEEYEYEYFLDVSIFFENDRICFIGDENYRSMNEIEGNITNFSARNMSYSFEYEQSQKDTENL